MALVVYNAALKPELRKEAEKSFGSKLQDKWYKLAEYGTDLKKYYRPARSSRSDVVTTLDKAYGSDVAISLDFSASIPEEPEVEEVDVAETEEPDPCDDPHREDDCVYDSDWL